MNSKLLLPILLVVGLAACSSAPKKSSSPNAAVKGVKVEGRGQARVATGCPATSPYAAAKEDPATRGNYAAGGLYKPGVSDSTPDYVPNVACIPEPLVTNEPRSEIGNKSPYEVLGKKYRVMDRVKGYSERGTASYYGSKFHGRLTSNKEVYDMYAFTAAHKTLPLPSFALVTNLDNGESVVVRVNDRGPFHDGRLIDLSYAAAVKLGITARGTGNVEVRALTEDDNPELLARRGNTAPALAAATATARVPADSSIDRLVQKLPARKSATPAEVARSSSAQSAGAAERWRYRVADTQVSGGADNFDAWMKANGVHVATGKPGTPVARSTIAASATATSSQQPVASSMPVAQQREPDPTDSALGSILLQVASFSKRENANRALAQLASAGIAGASISDIASGGRTLWRLRVNASDQANARELASRIAGLGFGRPRIVAN
jgi:rare lipoprotein A